MASGEVIESLLLVATDLLFDRRVFYLYEKARRRAFYVHMATIRNDACLIKSAMIFKPQVIQAHFDLAYKQSMQSCPWQTIMKSIEYDINNENPKSIPRGEIYFPASLSD